MTCAGISRHEMTISEATEVPPRCVGRSRGRLRQVNECAVIAEIGREQFWVAIQSQPADHQALEMAQQEIREVERPRFGLGESGELKGGCEELVAMCARDPLNAFFAQYIVEQ